MTEKGGNAGWFVCDTYTNLIYPVFGVVARAVSKQMTFCRIFTPLTRPEIWLGFERNNVKIFAAVCPGIVR